MSWQLYGFEDPFFREGPFSALKRFQEEMNRLFDGDLYSRSLSGGQETAFWDGAYPRVNLWSNEEGAVLTAEVAGADPKEIDVSVLGNTVTIKGSRHASEVAQGERLLRRERGAGEFHRTLQLPFSVEAAAVDAECKDGILTVRLPRASEERPKRITVR